MRSSGSEHVWRNSFSICTLHIIKIYFIVKEKINLWFFYDVLNVFSDRWFKVWRDTKQFNIYIVIVTKLDNQQFTTNTSPAEWKFDVIFSLLFILDKIHLIFEVSVRICSLKWRIWGDLSSDFFLGSKATFSYFLLKFYLDSLIWSKNRREKWKQGPRSIYDSHVSELKWLKPAELLRWQAIEQLNLR